MESKSGSYRCNGDNRSTDFLQTEFPSTDKPMRFVGAAGLNRVNHGEKVPIAITECYDR
jgi:hypothetical protein